MSNKSKHKQQEALSRKNLLSEHAMEFVALIRDVVYINDSISINVEKTWNTLNSVDGNVILIIGGIDSKNDYAALEELVTRKVKYIISLSSDSNRLMKAFLKTGREIAHAATVQESVGLAMNVARAGDLVLFSPACPSYHPFDNYKNRGNDFKRAVNALLQAK
ncbi:MAG: hypothetical protein AB1458_12740 [Bacteroidota bacterium]